MMNIKKTGIILASSAAILFAAGALTTISTPAQADGVKCIGANECKGHSACKGGANANCAGANECKGQGWVEAPDAAACEEMGGHVGE